MPGFPANLCLCQGSIQRKLGHSLSALKAGNMLLLLKMKMMMMMMMMMMMRCRYIDIVDGDVVRMLF